MNPTNRPGKVSLSTKARRAVWNFCQAILFRPFVTRAFRLWRIALLRAFGAKVSWKANVYATAKIWAPWHLRMADGSCLGPDVICYNQDDVTLGNDTIVSQYAYLCTAGHETDHSNKAVSGLVTAPITIEDGAWIGTRAFIGMGVVVGHDSIVGATASVYKDVEPGCVVGGNPAKTIKMRDLAIINRGGVKRLFPICSTQQATPHKERRVA